ADPAQRRGGELAGLNPTARLPVLHLNNGAEADQVGEQAVQLGVGFHGGMVRQRRGHRSEAGL
ncbi:hypothetical protein, partial [Microbulbifer discodermiae]|uniref:hypothetical protein n=1 Tax=Microbulbifer sp. 2201CG32-9 TaxID=3232309 RepID=UPI00345C12A7